MNDENTIIFLSNLWHSMKNKRHATIMLNFESTKWIDANLCSPLGLIVDRLRLRRNKVYFKNVSRRILRVLENNKFLPVARTNNSDGYESTHIAFERFETKEKDKFERYLVDELACFFKNNKFDIDQKALLRVISEMFINVKMHTKAKEVITCGHYLPKKKELYFTISNHGITIKKNIEEKNGYIFNNDIEAINWAVKKSSSTRQRDESGGLGFYIARDFINKNKGSLYIISGRGFRKEENEAIEISNMKTAFPGTIVTFKVMLEDKKEEKAKVEKDVFTIDEILRGGLWNV